MNVQVRPATLDDVGAMAAIHVAGYEEAYRGHIPDEVIDERTPELRRRVWAERVAAHDPREFVFVAELDDTIRAFVSGRQAASGEVGLEDPRVGIWENLYTDPEVLGDARGFQVALELRKAVERGFAERGYREAVAFVMEHNDRAERFFRLIGWERDGGVLELEGRRLHRMRRHFGGSG